MSKIISQFNKKYHGIYVIVDERKKDLSEEANNEVYDLFITTTQINGGKHSILISM